MERLEYTSANGYSGILYGKSSMAIVNPEGKEVMHTGHRTPNTFEELKEIVDTMPEFIEKLNAMMKDKEKCLQYNKT